jgi:hypothetical protein
MTAMAVSGVLTFCGASVLARHVDQGIPFWHARFSSHVVVKVRTTASPAARRRGTAP